MSSTAVINWRDVHAPSMDSANALYAQGLNKIGDGVGHLKTTAKDFQNAVKEGIKADITSVLNEYNPEDFYNHNREATLSSIHNKLKEIDAKTGGEVTAEMFNIANTFAENKVIEQDQLYKHAQNQEKHKQLLGEQKANDIFFKAVKEKGSIPAYDDIAINAQDRYTQTALQSLINKKHDEQVERDLAQIENADKIDTYHAKNAFGLVSQAVMNAGQMLASSYNPLSGVDRKTGLKQVNQTISDISNMDMVKNMTPTARAKFIKLINDDVLSIAKQFGVAENSLADASVALGNLQVNQFKAETDAEYKATQSAIDAEKLKHDIANDKSKSAKTEVDKTQEEMQAEITKKVGAGWVNPETNELNGNKIVNYLKSNFSLDEKPMTVDEYNEWVKEDLPKLKKANENTGFNLKGIGFNKRNEIIDGVVERATKYGLSYRDIVDVVTHVASSGDTGAWYNKMGYAKTKEVATTAKANRKLANIEQTRKQLQEFTQQLRASHPNFNDEAIAKALYADGNGIHKGDAFYPLLEKPIQLHINNLQNQPKPKKNIEKGSGGYRTEY